MSDETLSKYFQKCHAMQTGVAMEMTVNTKPTEPKHLRVGVNTAMCDHSALVKLLISKGIITEEEYRTAILNEMTDEVERYKTKLSRALGLPVNLY